MVTVVLLVLVLSVLFLLFLSLHVFMQSSSHCIDASIQIRVSTRVLTFCLSSSRGTRFFHRLILLQRIVKSFNSMMSFVGIYVNKSFTFSVSVLTVFQSWSLRKGNVVFFSDMIFVMGLY